MRVVIHSVDTDDNGPLAPKEVPMAHPDPYRLTTASTEESKGGGSRVDLVRTLLWTVVVVSAGANTVASYGGVATWLQLSIGIVTLLAATTLVVRHLRGRR